MRDRGWVVLLLEGKDIRLKLYSRAGGEKEADITLSRNQLINLVADGALVISQVCREQERVRRIA
jgi:hypothetical protein